jgi:hypothetical protein
MARCMSTLRHRRAGAGAGRGRGSTCWRGGRDHARCRTCGGGRGGRRCMPGCTGRRCRGRTHPRGRARGGSHRRAGTGSGARCGRRGLGHLRLATPASARPIGLLRRPIGFLRDPLGLWRGRRRSGRRRLHRLGRFHALGHLDHVATDRLGRARRSFGTSMDFALRPLRHVQTCLPVLNGTTSALGSTPRAQLFFMRSLRALCKLDAATADSQSPNRPATGST